MKQIHNVIAIICLPMGVYGQIDTVNLNYDWEKAEISISKKDHRIQWGRTHVIKVNGINDAHIKPTIKVNSFKYVSDPPPILEQFNIHQSLATLPMEKKWTGHSSSLKPFDRAFDHYNFLKSISDIGEKLYDSTSFRPNQQIGNSYFEELSILCNAREIDTIKSFVVSAINFINGTERLYQSLVKNQIDPSVSSITFLDEYAELQSMTNQLDINEYLELIDFIESSRTANGDLFSKTFRGEKDGVDLTLQLIDIYKNDTIAIERITLKTYGNFSFDFSTGFFYSDLVDPDYNLNARDTLINNVIKEPITPFDISVGALAHFSFKVSPEFKTGIALGASLSPFDQKTRYHGGASFLIGFRKKVAAFIGVSVAQVKKNSTTIQSDDIGLYLPVSVSEVPTYNKVATGLSIALTYNLTQEKK